VINSWKPGDRATLRDLGNLVEITQIIGNGRVEVRFIPHGGRMIVTADKSLQPVTDR
jgi:hypothetical protein